MNLVSLAYYSRITRPLAKSDLRDILAKSVTNNQRDNVTGALLFTQGVFLQVLEGNRSNVNGVFRRIYPDPRHTEIAIIGFAPIEDREFSNWSMAYIDESKITKAMLVKYCGGDKLRGEYMTLESARALAREAIA